MDDHYSVLVIGGGPAGAAAAWKAAQAGAKTLLVERDREIGLPVRCAEAVSGAGLRQIMPLPAGLIANQIKNQRFLTPDGGSGSLTAGQELIILERRLFDAYVARLAAEAGAEIHTRADAVAMNRIEEGWEVAITLQGRAKRVRADLVIAADGVESRVARWAGIDTTLALDDLESAAQYSLTNLAWEDSSTCAYIVGNDIAPGGYIWVFPKSKYLTNVGIGILASRSTGKTAREYLDEFVAERFPQAQAVAFVSGGIPVAPPLKRLAADHLLIVGDAARLVESLSGAGIGTAVLSGTRAGEVAGRAVQKDRFQLRFLQSYDRAMAKDIGRLKVMYRIGRILRSISDQGYCQINDLAGKAGSKLNVFELCRIIVRHDPTLLLSLPKLFGKDVGPGS